MTGENNRTAMVNGLAKSIANFLLNRTPSVFGRISVYWSMTKVNKTEKSHIQRLPKISPYAAPAMEAPIVWAAVLIARITEMGRSIFFFNWVHWFPILGCVWEISPIWLVDKLNKTDSKREQSPETEIATKRLTINTVMNFNNSVLSDLFRYY